MAERITITIPENLHTRLQVVKDTLNVSRICQEALDTAIRIEELKREESPNMDTLIERLQIEKEQDTASWKEEGVIQGQKDALTLCYKEFKELESEQSISKDLTDWIKENHFQYMDSSIDEDAYLEGWLEGVLSIWDKVKESL